MNDEFWEIVDASYSDLEFAQLSAWADKMIAYAKSNPEWTV